VRTAITEMFGIDVPIVAFMHCRDVVVAVSKAGGMGVLGAAGHSDRQLEIDLEWIEAEIGDHPYGVDLIVPARYAGSDAGGMTMTEILSMIPDEHRVFVDGRDRVDCCCDCNAVVGGDAVVASIAAASIVAKVTRDRLMARIGAAHPGYGFERHMGYSVPEHFAALQRLGPTIHHRRSFAPVARAWGEPAEIEVVAQPSMLPL